jgi:hypothetical protein
MKAGSDECFIMGGLPEHPWPFAPSGLAGRLPGRWICEALARHRKSEISHRHESKSPRIMTADKRADKRPESPSVVPRAIPWSELDVAPIL